MVLLDMVLTADVGGKYTLWIFFNVKFFAFTLHSALKSQMAPSPTKVIKGPNTALPYFIPLRH